MFTYIFVILIVLSIVILANTKYGKKFFGKFESETFLRDFQISHDFELIQDWNANDFPVGIGKSLGSSINQKIYAAIGSKNQKTYLILKQVNSSPISANVEYYYIEQASFEKLKKIV